MIVPTVSMAPRMDFSPLYVQFIIHASTAVDIQMPVHAGHLYNLSFVCTAVQYSTVREWLHAMSDVIGGITAGDSIRVPVPL